jgi:hypothetical protein
MAEEVQEIREVHITDSGYIGIGRILELSHPPHRREEN